MTRTKQIRLLGRWIYPGTEGYIFIQYIDDWASEEDNEVVRESRSLGDLLAQFVAGEGELYEAYRSGSEFKELLKMLPKWIDNPETKKVKKFYKDSYLAYKKNWEKENPGLIFEVEMERRRKEKARRARRAISHMMSFYIGDLPFTIFPRF